MIDYVDPPPPDWKRTRRLLLVLIVTVIAAVAYSTRAEPILDCLGDVSELEHVTIQTGNRNRPLTDAQLQAIAAIEGESIWIGYENGGWDYPDGIEAMSFTRYWVFGKREGVRFWVILYIGAEWSYGKPALACHILGGGHLRGHEARLIRAALGCDNPARLGQRRGRTPCREALVLSLKHVDMPEHEAELIARILSQHAPSVRRNGAHVAEYRLKARLGPIIRALNGRLFRGGPARAYLGHVRGHLYGPDNPQRGACRGPPVR